MFLKDIPNILTALRIALIPILVLSFYLEGDVARYVAAGIFLFASVTDFFDGFLARLWKVESSFGMVLDPIADKMLVASTLLMLVYKDMAPVLPILAILCREMLISGMREYLAQIKVSVPVSNLAKIKTAVQMLAIVILLLGEQLIGISHMDYVGKIALWIAAILTLVTGYAYFREGFKHI
jgi:cardiolipin synthase (CMP-forming)